MLKVSEVEFKESLEAVTDLLSCKVPSIEVLGGGVLATCVP